MSWFGSWRRWRDARTLVRRAIPDDLWRQTLAQFPFLAMRSNDDMDRLREMTTLFLAAKEFTGARGLQVTDQMAVAIAAQACLPALQLGLHWYDGFVGIVVHEDAVVARRESSDEAGVVHAYDEALSGEAMSGGPVMLSWSDVQGAGDSAAWAYNVVVHEFAHVLDMRGSFTLDLGEVGVESVKAAWLASLTDEYEAFCNEVDRGDDSLLDPYGAEALEEFFAVGAEAFFVASDALRDERPVLYELLRNVFRQDPAEAFAAS